MGVLNVTPDSFSDGGRYLDTDAAVEHAFRMVDCGAAVIDVGGESTRPGAGEVPVEIELQRIIPVLKALSTAVRVPLSVDTRHAEVAEAAVRAGASIINNVMPLAGDPAMARVAAVSGAGLVVMHMRGNPAVMNTLAVYGDVVEEVVQELRESYAFALANGVAAEQIVVDPGIGFAKELDHNLKLLACLERLREIAPVLVGVSRKRFIGEIAHVHDAEERVGGSLAAALWSVLRGASVIRVHDVRESCQAVSVLDAIRKAAETGE